MADENENIVPSEEKISAAAIDFKIFAEEFRDEPDRSAVILGTAKLDNLLYQLLQKYMLPNKEKRSDLLKNDGPLYSFSARVSVCYRLGLINVDTEDILHTINKIRNTFAHDPNIKSLESNSHKDKINYFFDKLNDDSLYNSLLNKYFNHNNTHSAKFRAGLALISIRLIQQVQCIEPIKLDNSLKI